MRPRLALTGSLFLGFLALGSCSAPDDQSFVILRASPLSSDPSSPSICSTEDSGGAGMGSVFQSTGVLDLTLVNAYRQGYVICPVVENRKPSRAAQNRGIESGQIYLQGVDVDISFDQDPGVPFADNEIRFRERLFNRLDPEGGIATVGINGIPAATALRLAQSGIQDGKAFVKIRFIGTSNEDLVKSNEMNFEVRLCRGCLLNFVGPCCADATLKGSPNIVQDNVIDCCDAGGVICPARKIDGPACGTTTP